MSTITESTPAAGSPAPAADSEPGAGSSSAPGSPPPPPSPAGDTPRADGAPAGRKGSRARAQRADASPKRGPGRPSKSAQRQERIATALTSLGLGVSLLHAGDGQAVILHADNVAKALAQLADENPRIAKLLDGATEGNAWLGLAIAVAPLVLTIAANHGLLGLPPALASTPPGDAQGDPLGGLGAILGGLDLAALSDLMGGAGGAAGS